MEDSLVMEEEGIWVPRVNIFMDSFKIVDQEKYTNIVLSVVMVGILSSIFWLGEYCHQFLIPKIPFRIIVEKDLGIQ